jgi:hypothetical protein
MNERRPWSSPYSEKKGLVVAVLVLAALITGVFAYAAYGIATMRF